MRLLIAEDDPRAARQLVADMTEIGHEVVVAEDGRAALRLATTENFDAVLLDIMLPYVDGVKLARLLRERGLNLPIVMLSVLGGLDDRLKGLDAGADDYLVKPAAPAEIDARLRAIVRRAMRVNENGVMRAGDIEVNEIMHRAVRGGRVMSLPKLEFRVLCELIRYKNSVVTRDMFYRNVWAYDFQPATNMVESYIRRVRAQLIAAGEPDPIETIRGVGYMLVAPSNDAG